MMKAKLTKKQLDILYECWKEGINTKERLSLIEEKMPKVSTLTALKVMRKMAKTDTKWLKWTTRQNNLIEKEKLDKKIEKERKIREREKKREERIIRKEEKLKKQAHKKKKTLISKNIDILLVDQIKEKVSKEFFFCPDTHQYVNNISCIFRIFNDFSFGSCCDKCKRMNKHIPVLEEIVNGQAKNVKKQRSKRYKTSGGSKNKE